MVYTYRAKGVTLLIEEIEKQRLESMVYRGRRGKRERGGGQRCVYSTSSEWFTENRQRSESIVTEQKSKVLLQQAHETVKCCNTGLIPVRKVVFT